MNDAISRCAVLKEIAHRNVFDTMKAVDFDRSMVFEWVKSDMFRIVQNAPTIDAVPVVRCKDCIHAVAITNLTIANRCGLGQKNCMRQRGDDGFGFTGVSVVYPDGFCDEGARMDGESEEDT